ncbi:Rhodanese-like protein [Xylaria acuta]|nr:Rhodanese-like protein [Xylaria acuta]
MSLITLSSLERITASKLADLLLAAGAANATAGEQAAKNSIAIVDVRDDDHIGGHIRTSMHFPSNSLDATMPTLLRRLADKETVVFHCALSQQRGPSAALRYLREREAAGGTVAGNKEGGSDKKQKVYVLDRGFVGWQEVYGTDECLTEGYRKELWEEY